MNDHEIRGHALLGGSLSRGHLDTISPFLMPAALHTKEALHSIKHLRADLLKIACDKPPYLRKPRGQCY